MSRDPDAGLTTLVGRAVRRCCPRCGAKAFESWFTMRENCPACGLRFEREPGYWVGAVIINTTVIFATFLVTFGALVIGTWPDVNWLAVLIVTGLVNTLVPIFFYPLSKTIWSALELSWHALEAEEVASAAKRIRAV